MSSKSISIFIIIILIAAAAYAFFYWFSMRGVKAPEYKVLKKDNNIEIRQYAPMLVAEVTVVGSRDKAIRSGFIILASYIFGANTMGETDNSKIDMTAPVIQQKGNKIDMTAPVVQEQGGKIDMTSPVVQEPAAASSDNSSSKIDMTSPVVQEPAAASSDNSSSKIDMTSPVIQTGSDDKWIIKFVMPRKYNINNIPKPNNKNIKLIEVPSSVVVAIRFSGIANTNKLNDHKNKLMSYIKGHDLQLSSVPRFAFYNPPWTLPFMRRNEVMADIKNYK